MRTPLGEALEAGFGQRGPQLPLLLAGRPKLVICLFPIEVRKGFIDGLKEVCLVQRLEGYVLIANIELHLLNQGVGFRKHPVEFALKPRPCFGVAML